MIELVWIDNVKKKKAGEVTALELLQSSDSEEALLQLFQDSGFAADDPSLLFLRAGDCFVKYSQSALDTYQNYNDLKIIYSAITGHSNAAEFARCNGITYTVRPKENCHLFSPHIHAFCSGEEISIELDTFEAKGSFKSKGKTREAIAFAKCHCEELKKYWHDFIGT